MEAVRADLIADCGGGEAVGTARRLLIDLAAAAAVRCQRVNAYLASPNSLVDKRHRREWQVVNARRAEAHLQGLLRDIGLERKAKPVEDLRSYATTTVRGPRRSRWAPLRAVAEANRVERRVQPEEGDHHEYVNQPDRARARCARAARLHRGSAAV